MPGVPWAPLTKTCPPPAQASSPIQACQTRPHRSREPGGQRASPRSRRAQGLSSASPRPHSMSVLQPASARSLWSAPLGASLPRPRPRPLPREDSEF